MPHAYVRTMGGLAVVVGLLLSVLLVAQQSPRELFERARLLEDSSQNLAEAISLYGQVVDQASAERALAATAQLRLGLLYERLGRTTDAQRAFEAVVNEYADQRDLAQQAHARIAAIAPRRERSGVILREVNINATQVWFALSPDGNQVVYTGAGGALVIRDLTTGSDRAIASGGQPVWSPDGTQVAYTNWQNYWTHELQIVSVETGDEQHREINGRPIGWSRDGRFILYGEGFFTPDDPTFNLLPVDGGPTQTLNLTHLDSYGQGGMSLSPDARYLVYGSETDDNWDLYVMPVAGGTPFRLTDDPGVDSEPVWSPDGQTILFKSNRSLGRWDLWAVRVTDGRRSSEPFVVRPDIGERATVHTWSESGKLLFSTNDSASFVYVVPTGQTGQGERRAINLTADTKNSRDPIWSPDGTRIAYFSNDALNVMLADGTGLREIATGLVKFTGPYAWAADGEHILIPVGSVGAGERRPAIISVSVRTGEITPVFEEQELLGHLARSPDGSRLVFLKGLRHHQLFSVHADGSDLQQLTFDEESRVYNPTFSPDGREIALERRGNGKRSIVVIPASGGEPRVLVDSDDHDQGERLGAPAWGPDGSTLVYVTHMIEDGNLTRSRLWVISTSDDTQPRELHIDLGPSGEASGLAQPQWSPDGTQIVLTAGNPVSQLWVMENFLPEAP